MENLLYKLSLMVGAKSGQEMLVRLIIAGVILVLFVLFNTKISKALSHIACKILFSKSEKAQKAIKDSLVKPLSYFVSISGFYTALEIALPKLSENDGKIQTILLLLVKISFIVLTAWFGVNFINSDYSIQDKLDSSVATKSAMKFINNFLKWAIVVIAVLLVLEQFGISASKLFAALGIGGVAVAFACKDMVENMLSGFIIIFDKPFDVDDFIEINGDSGTVTDIKIRTTRLIGVDGCEKVYPNTTMANAIITNWTRMEKRAIKEDISVNYSSSSEKLNEICVGVKELLKNHEGVLDDDIRVNFTEFSNHALTISLFFYVDKVKAPEYFALKNDINVELKKYFDENNVDLAFESKTLYFGDELKIKK